MSESKIKDPEKEKQLEQFRAYVEAAYSEICPVVSEEVTSIEEWIPSADGAKLRTIIIRPKNAEGPLPTIVQRSCYYHTANMLQTQGEVIARHGFALVYQWCRGIGGSEGSWEPNIYDRADGLSLMNWLQEQTWAANIGYVGASYLAMTGWIMADAVPEKVKTMYLTVYGTVRHTSAWREGLFRQDILTAWAKDNAGFPIEADYIESAKFRPQCDVDVKLWGGKLDWYRDWITHPGKADPYWAEGHWEMLRQIPSKLKIPVFVGEGWYDHHLGSMLEGYTSLSKEAAAHSTFQIMAGNHGMRPAIPGQPKQENAAINEAKQQAKWFYDILVKETLPEPSVQYYLIGADEWRTYDEYPPKTKGEAQFYLNEDRLAYCAGKKAERNYIYNPDDPVITHGAESLFRSWEHIGSLQQPDINWRPDVLSYVSDTIENDLDIVGPITAKLWVKSDAPDTCFTIKIMEVFPDGTAWHIRSGITTLGWRNGATELQSYNGEAVELEIKCWDVAWRLQKGSKLRVDISSSNFPEYSVHPNTTTLWSMAKEVRIANQTIISGEEYPSRIILPLDKR